jgi:folate-binding protein YgfZ
VAVADQLATEYEALTTGQGLVDRSERGKLLLTGTEVKDFLQGQVTNDVEALREDTGCYAAFLTHKGKMLGDMRVFDAGAAGVFVDTERVVLQDLFNMIHRFKLGRDVEIHKRTLERGLLSLVGPQARRVDGPEHTHRLDSIGGATVRLIATDLGTDVVCDAEVLPAVTEALIAEGAVPVGAAAAEIVRVESGRPRYGVDLDASVIPQEAGLNARAVNFEKGCYVGQETVARLFYRGKPNRRLCGLRSSALLSTGTPLTLGERQVGAVLSSVVSPSRGPLALALVRREAAVGDVVAVGADSAVVVELPFA